MKSISNYMKIEIYPGLRSSDNHMLEEDEMLEMNRKVSKIECI
jgi:hypothetical protein